MKKIMLFLLCFSFLITGCSKDEETIKIGSKNFTESIILSEIYSQALENAGYKVERKLNLGGTMIAHEALKNGDIDLYPEYTGTALLAILKEPTMSNPSEVYNLVKNEYESKYGLIWLQSTEINDSQALVMRNKDVKENNLQNLSDLSSKANLFRMAAQADFAEREDGLKGLQSLYGGFTFKDMKVFDNGIKYQVLKNEEADIVVGYTTDPQLLTGEFVTLLDDKGLWPPYYVAPVIRKDKNTKEIQTLINKVSRTLTTEKMIYLNGKVDLDKEDPKKVAKDYLAKEGL